MLRKPLFRRWLVATGLLAISIFLRSYARGMRDTGYYLPSREDSRIVTVTKSGSASAGFTVITQAVAEREIENNSAKTCQVYAFVPSFIAVRRNEPTQISFRNYQADDDHDFMLVGPDSTKVLMFVPLPKLRETSYVFTFHKDGLFRIYCTMHQPNMSGQILVLPPAGVSAGAPRVEGSAATPIAPSETFETAAKAATVEPRLPDCVVRARRLEEELGDALRKKDWDAAAKLLSPSFQSAGAEGVHNRAAELALLKNLDVTPHTVGWKITYSGDVAILTFESYYFEHDPSGAPRRKASRILSVWRMTNAGWQQIARAEIPLVETVPK